MKKFFQYFSAAGLALVLFLAVTHGWRLQITLPIFYNVDSVHTSTLIKSIIDTGWFDTNKYIGAPRGYDLSDFPMNADNLHFLAVKVLTLFSKNFVIVYNLFFLLSIPLTAISALFVFQRMRMRYPFALAGAVLFALQPYFFYRVSEGHLFLAAYYVVPLTVWLCTLVVAGHNICRQSSLPRWVRMVGYFLLCAVIGSTGIYYAVFGIFFIIVSGLIMAVELRSKAPFHHSVLLCAIIFCIVSVNLLPSLSHRVAYGKNTEVAHRAPFEAELYGLKITQLLLPVDNDRVPILARLKNNYNNTAPMVVSENRFTALGIIASAGFIILLGSLVLGIRVGREFDLLAKLNIAGILLGVIGGFGSIIAYTVTPMIRCYARISIFIAFFSLYAFFYCLQKFSENYRLLNNAKSSWCLAFVCLALGVISQTEPHFSQWQSQLTINTFRSDRQFVKNIEKIMSDGSQIYQMPYVPFPEQPPVVAMLDYENLRVYLHSKNLKWSYGAVKGRPLAFWMESISKLPVSSMINQIAYAGYNGIYIDRNGYMDHGVEVEKNISKILHIKPVVSENNNLSFFDLRGYIEGLQKEESPSDWQRHVREFFLKTSVSFSWGSGFYGLEASPESEWRWCDKSGRLSIVNYSNRPININIAFNVATGGLSPSTIVITGPSTEEVIKVGRGETFRSIQIKLMPGVNRFKFSSDARQTVANGDSRRLFFFIKNFTWKIIG